MSAVQSERCYGIGLSNTWSDEDRRLQRLEALFDPATFRHLDTLGVAQGTRCLEVGGGGGSVARFLADRVGPRGTVVVTDVDLSRLRGCDRPEIETLTHDITSDPLPEAWFDVVHARAVLEHLPARLAVLAKLVGALRPGGWILIEDTDFSAAVHLPPSRQLFVPEEYGFVQQRLNAAVYDLVGPNGVDLEFGRHLPAHLAALGLEAIDGEACSRLVRGGTERAEFFELSLREVAPSVVGTGLVTEDDVTRALAELRSPNSMMQSFPMVSAWGRRPATATVPS